MSQACLTLELPEDVYEHIARAARGMKQPVEKALINIVRGATPSLEKVPLEYREELAALEDLSDDKLWAISGRCLEQAKRRRLEKLLDKNAGSELTDRDRQTLSRLRLEADHLLLRRSYAFVLLKYRGHRVTSFGDTKQ